PRVSRPRPMAAGTSSTAAWRVADPASRSAHAALRVVLLGRSHVQPGMPRLLPHRADRRRERGGGEGADGDAYEPGVPARAPVQRGSAPGAEMGRERMARVGRTDEQLRFA